MGLSWGKIGRMVKYFFKNAKYKKSLILNAYFPFSCMQVTSKLSLKLIGWVEVLNVLWMFVEMLQGQGWHTFCRQHSVFVWGRFPKSSWRSEEPGTVCCPDSVTEVPQWVLPFWWWFPAEGLADADKMERNRITISKHLKMASFKVVVR